jgi:hypothetical protein
MTTVRTNPVDGKPTSIHPAGCQSIISLQRTSGQFYKVDYLPTPDRLVNVMNFG